MATLALIESYRNKILNALFNHTPLDVVTVNLSLHSGDPGATGANELSGGSYARKAASFSAAASGAVSNDAEVLWTGLPAVGAPGVQYVGFWDGTTYMGGAQLVAAKIINAGDSASFAVGELDITQS